MPEDANSAYDDPAGWPKMPVHSRMVSSNTSFETSSKLSFLSCEECCRKTILWWWWTLGLLRVAWTQPCVASPAWLWRKDTTSTVSTTASKDSCRITYVHERNILYLIFSSYLVLPTPVRLKRTVFKWERNERDKVLGKLKWKTIPGRESHDRVS